MRLQKNEIVEYLFGKKHGKIVDGRDFTPRFSLITKRSKRPFIIGHKSLRGRNPKYKIP